jgi:hypothetical protein
VLPALLAATPLVATGLCQTHRAPCALLVLPPRPLALHPSLLAAQPFAPQAPLATPALPAFVVHTVRVVLLQSPSLSAALPALLGRPRPQQAPHLRASARSTSAALARHGMAPFAQAAPFLLTVWAATHPARWVNARPARQARQHSALVPPAWLRAQLSVPQAGEDHHVPHA